MRFLQALSLPSLNFRQTRGTGLLAVFLLSLLAVGCGSSSGGGYVAGPDQGGSNNPTTGSVTFNFVQAQSAIVVPTGTNSLRFEFFSELNGSGALVYRATNAYAASVTIANVPTSARSAVVTAIDSDGFPVSEFTVNVNVPANGNTTVSASTGTSVAVTLTGISATPISLSLGLDGVAQLSLAANFSNGDQVPLTGDLLDEVTFSSSDASVVDVDGAPGTVRAVLTGDAVVTATFRGFDATVPVIVSVGGGVPPIAQDLELSVTSVTLAQGTQSEPIVATATFNDGTERPVTAQQGLTFTSTDGGVTVDSNQRIVAGPGVTPGTTATVTFFYLGQTATVTVTVNAATLTGIAVEPASISLPFGGFEQELVVRGTFSNGQSLALSPGNGVNQYTLAENSDLFSLDGATLVTAANGGAGSGIVTATSGSFTAQSAVSVGQVFIEELTISPASVTLNPGQDQDFAVTALLSDGRSFAVTDFAALQISLGSGTGSVVLNDNRVVATSGGSGTRNINFSFPGAGLGGLTVTASAVVTVEALTLESIAVTFAGNAIPLTGVNLPRGYVGIFEVIGTFSNGSVRRLDADEYHLEQVGEATLGYNPDPYNAVQIFDQSYAANGYSQTTAAFNSTAVFPRRGLINQSVGNPRSTFATAVVGPDFPAVVADWRRSETVPGGPFAEAELVINTPAPGSGGSPSSVGGNIGNFDLFNIVIDGYEELNVNNISVTVIDPVGTVAVDTSSAFAFRPTDPVLLVGTAREFAVRVDFEQASAGDNGETDIDPPTYDPPAAPITGFKLAEVNMLFRNDVESGNPNFVTHRPTPLGFPALFVANAVQASAIEVGAIPLAGPGARVQEVTAGVFDYARDTFGATSPITYEIDEATGAISVEFTYIEVNNSTNIDILVANVLRLDPNVGSLELPVGGGQLFRTLAQYRPGNPFTDVSLDYRPTVTTGEGTVVVSQNALDSGHVTVNAIAPGAAVVQALDVLGNVLPARGTGSFTTTNITVTGPTP